MGEPQKIVTEDQYVITRALLFIYALLKMQSSLASTETKEKLF